jgi:hypothetical protein
MKTERTMFQVVKSVGRKWVTIDGKRRRRQKTFRENVDLFNVNESGKPKSFDEVMDSVRSKVMAWERDVN